MGSFFSLLTLRPTTSSSTINSDNANLQNGRNLRKEAHLLTIKSKQLRLESQSSYLEGNKLKAKQLSNESKQLSLQITALQQQASAIIFNHYNQGRNLLLEIDLHELYVDEAIERLERILKKLSIANDNSKGEIENNELLVIVGRGIHSVDGQPKLKPAITKYLIENSSYLNYTLDSGTNNDIKNNENIDNRGVLKVVWNQTKRKKRTFCAIF